MPGYWIKHSYVHKSQWWNRKEKDQTHYHRLADPCVYLCVCVWYIYVYKCCWVPGIYRSPFWSQTKGRSAWWIHPDMHTTCDVSCVHLSVSIPTCVCVCALAGQRSVGTVHRSRGQTGERGGEREPGLSGLVWGVWRGLCWQRCGKEGWSGGRMVKQGWGVGVGWAAEKGVGERAEV